MNISINQISYQYKQAESLSLDNISVDIKSGSKHGIFGANGAGKSTLIKAICNVIQPNVGTIQFSDKGEIIPKELIKQMIGYVPQDFAFYEELTIWNNIKYFGVMFNLPDKVIKERYDEFMELFALTNFSKKRIKTFSGGMKRKVNLMLGLLHNPSLIVLDEPIVGIDVHSKSEILNYLNGLHQSGKTIIYTSHQMNESQSFCDNFTLIDNGKSIVTGNLLEILDHQGKKDLESILLDL